MKYKLKSWIFAIAFLIAIIPFEKVYSVSLALGGNKVKYQSVHDPSIVVGYMDGNNYSSSTKIYGTQNSGRTRTKVYFVFGSHLAFAYSLDLQNWETFTNNITNDYKNLFKTGFDWASSGDSSYDPAGNMWAPDVIWNPTLNKWTMYMSINGRAWNSCIFLLTADSLNGSWTSVGPVIYSGFTGKGTKRSLTKTDYSKVTGDSDVNKRYVGNSQTWAGTEASTWNTSYGPHAIDPCVFFGEDQRLYMSYGSWSGGIYVVLLDRSTGLRDYSVTYNYKDAVSDPYFGYKIAGGLFVSGEASYIQRIGNYYYLWLSYGGLTADGGYNMRIFRSSNPTGPYVDSTGNKAVFTTNSDNINGSIGVRELSYYKWSFMNQGYAAQGHNSAFVDDDGRAYVVYHTRYTNSGEVHTMRVHQIFVNEDGWLVTAPFQFSGEYLNSGINNNDVAGTYEAIFHTSCNYKNKETVKINSLTFSSDGKVTGDKAGTWAFTSKPYATLVLNKVTYKGVFVQQRKPGADDAGALWNTDYYLGDTVMTFAALGANQIEAFGTK